MFFYRFCCISALFVLMLPKAVHAQFTYVTNGDAVSITVTGYTGTNGSVVIPNTINGFTVTGVGMNAFNGNTSLISITIPSSVTSIGDEAFFGCTNLISAIFPDDLITIGNDSFVECYSLTNVTIPNSVTSIELGAFDGCSSLSSITIPDSVTNLGDGAFGDCTSLTNIFVEAGNPDYSSLNGVLFDKAQDTLLEYPPGLANSTYTIPDGVVTMAENAFWFSPNLVNITIPGSLTNIVGSQLASAFFACAALTNICVSANNPAYSSLNGVLFDKVQDALLQYPPGITNATYTIPSSVKTIEGDAFAICTNLVSITIPNSVNNIEQGAFQACISLTSLAIPNGVTYIPDEAFTDCASLTNIVIPNGVISIGPYAFTGCNSLTNVIIPASVTTIDDYAFEYSSELVSAYFEGNAPPDDGTVFYDDPTTVYYLPGTTGWGATFGGVPAVEETTPDDEFTWVTNSNAVTVTITGYAGSNNVVAIPETINGYAVTSIGTNAFLGNSILTSVIIPGSVSYIDDEAFADCTNLTSAILPDSIIGIGDFAFVQCTSLTNLTIPDSVTSIGQEAFQACTSLSGIFIPDSVTNIEVDAFLYCISMTNISVDADNEDYSSLDGVLFDKAQDTLLECPSGLTNTDYTIPEGVVTIAENAFWFSKNLVKITIPGSVTSIVGAPFLDCAGLIDICVNSTNPAYSSLHGVLFDKAQDTLLQYPPGLTNAGYIVLDSVTTIQGYAFYDCTNLVNITIPNGVTNLGFAAFLGCSSLASVIIPNGVSSIPQQAFAQCPNLASVIIPDSVTNIGPLAFNDCASLTSITIPASVNDIESLAFDSCTSLTSAYFEGNAPADGAGTFNNDPTTVYYLPGTTGWGATYGNVLTQPWFQPQPQVLTFEPSFGIQNNQFGFTISWATNASVIIQACTNLSNPLWLPVATNTLASGTNFFTDPSWSNYPSRYYRISAQ